MLDDAMKSRLDGIRRSFQALTERLGDPDVIADSNLLRQVMKDRSQSEEVVQTYDEVSLINDNNCRVTGGTIHGRPAQSILYSYYFRTVLPT